MEKNWALGENGAKVVEVSHEAAHVASAASNLLVVREELLWITGDAPQHVTLRIANPHPPLYYAGWHVWHDYLTNPKTVEIASGVSADEMVAQLLCNAIPGAGTQIWKLPNAIPPEHLFVRIKILESFGSGPTYMNNVVLFANDPGPLFRSTRNTDLTNKKENEGSVGRMSVLLRELDEDIKALHPIKTLSSHKNMLLYVPQDPTSVFPREITREEETMPSLRHDLERQRCSNAICRESQDRDAQGLCCGTAIDGFYRSGGEINSDITQSFNRRLCALEQAVASLTQSMNHQREDLTMIKRLLLQQASERRRELEQKVSSTQLLPAQEHDRPHRVSRHQVSVDFPEDALRSFVESTLAPKLQKYTKRAETQTLAKLDEFLKNIVGEINNAVDERIRHYLHEALPKGGDSLDCLHNNGNSSNNPHHHHSVGSHASCRTEQYDTHLNHLKNDFSRSYGRNFASYSPTVIRPSSSASSAMVAPVSTSCSQQGNDIYNAPVSIIRDISTEADLSCFGQGSRTRHVSTFNS